ncbi:MAG: PAS domain S-box protein [Bacteroidota bacterium]
MRETLTKEDLLILEIEALKRQLEEYKDLVSAIRNGEVDALAITKNGSPDIFTLESTDYVYRVLVENFAEGALNISETGMIVYANFAFETIIGSSTTSIMGVDIQTIIDPSSRKEFKRLFQKSFSGKSKGEIVLTYNGKSIPVYVSLSSLYPRFPGIGIIITDLSEKKKQEEKLSKQKLLSDDLEIKVQSRTVELSKKNNLLQQQKDFIEAVLNSSHDIISVYDVELRYVLLNKKVEELYNIKREDLIGKNIYEIYPNSKGSVIEKNIRLCLKGNHIEEEPYLSPTLNKWLQSYYIPIKDEKGVTYNALMISRDVTEMYDANIALERKNIALDESQSFFKQILDASVEFVSVLDTNLKFLAVNKNYEKLMNMKSEDFIGKKLFDLNPAVEGSESHQCILKALEGKQVKYEKQRGVAKPDMFFDTYFIPLVIRKKVKGVIIMSRDITDIVNNATSKKH